MGRSFWAAARAEAAKVRPLAHQPGREKLTRSAYRPTLDQALELRGRHEHACSSCTSERFGRGSLVVRAQGAGVSSGSFAQAALERGWLRLVFHRARRAQPVAASYGWNLAWPLRRLQRRILAPEWAKTSVGLLLMVHTLQRAHSIRGRDRVRLPAGRRALQVALHCRAGESVATVFARAATAPTAPYVLGPGPRARATAWDASPAPTGARIRRSLRPLIRRLPDDEAARDREQRRQPCRGHENAAARSRKQRNGGVAADE